MIIAADLFRPYIEGRELATASNWRDLQNYNTVQAGQLNNAFALDTYNARVNQANDNAGLTANQRRTSDLGLQVQETLQPGQLAVAGAQSQAALDFADPLYQARGQNNLLAESLLKAQRLGDLNKLQGMGGGLNPNGQVDPALLAAAQIQNANAPQAQGASSVNTSQTVTPQGQTVRGLIASGENVSNGVDLSAVNYNDPALLGGNITGNNQGINGQDIADAWNSFFSTNTLNSTRDFIGNVFTPAGQVPINQQSQNVLSRIQSQSALNPAFLSTLENSTGDIFDGIVPGTRQVIGELSGRTVEGEVDDNGNYWIVFADGRRVPYRRT